MKSNNVRVAVICAAGMGSRLGLDLPKCLVPMGGHRLIYFLLKLLADFEEVRVVVGFREEKVIEYIRSVRPDTVFVRNANFNATTNAFSLHLGTRDLREPYLTIDGDMIVDPDSFKQFLSHCTGEEVLLGLAEAKTEDAVFVSTDENGVVQSFSREPISDKEWSGIAYVPAKYEVRKEGKYVYQELERYLPVKSAMIKCWEVDTPQDLSLVMEQVEFSAYE